MKKRVVFTNLIKEKIIWLPAFLFSIIPTLAVYAHNLNFLSPERMLVPLLYSFVFMVLSGCVAYAIFKNEEKASVFTAVWVILFFSFGYILLVLGETKLGGSLPLSLNKLLFGTYGIILLLTVWFLFKTELTRRFIIFFSLVSITILIINLVKIVPFEINRWIDGGKLQQYVSKNLGQIDYLRSNGFWVGDESYANYPNTFLSLSSSLNMSYLQFLTDILGDQQADQANVYRQLLQDNQLARFLKSQGYKYVLFGSSWDPFQKKGIADENYNLLADFDEFHLYIYERTLLNAIRGIIEKKQLFTGTERFNKISLNLDYRLHRINRQKNQPQPLFVFGHFLLPNPPYVFSPECDSYTLSTSSQQDYENGYLNEIQCANIVMRSLISEIQSDSSRPSVIIFQSDEGPFLPLEYFNGDGESVPENFDAYFIHGAILNAVFLPAKDDFSKPANYEKIGFGPNLNPVNTIRTILNYYFETNLPILPDRTYFSLDNNERIYNFKDVTNFYDTKK